MSASMYIQKSNVFAIQCQRLFSLLPIERGSSNEANTIPTSPAPIRVAITFPYLLRVSPLKKRSATMTEEMPMASGQYVKFFLLCCSGKTGIDQMATATTTPPINVLPCCIMVATGIDRPNILTRLASTGKSSTKGLLACVAKRFQLG